MLDNIIDFEEYRQHKMAEYLKEVAEVQSKRFKKIFEKEKQYDKSNSN